jgi:hypothetical protein
MMLLKPRADDPLYRNRNPRFPAVYAALYPLLTDVANKLGYALAIHGSLMHDMDLVAVPWVSDAASQAELVAAFLASLEGSFVHEVGKAGKKPHGRTAYTLFLDNGAYIDLSVMSRASDAGMLEPTK